MKQFFVNMNKGFDGCDPVCQRITVLQNFKHFFTGKTHYLIREENMFGEFENRWVTEEEFNDLQEKVTYEFNETVAVSNTSFGTLISSTR